MNDTKRDYAIATVRDAINYLEQYRDYAENMRSVGRGFYPSGPFSTESVVAQLHRTIETLYEG